ncbi:hypothetical protein [Mesorhizobium sp. M0159]|uniref:hypothetical protein n=1 Tax=Mesorhizobium sp. M0159 TaxID=2956900 RepID=UPI003334D3DE
MADVYKAVSQQIREIFAEHTPKLFARLQVPKPPRGAGFKLLSESGQRWAAQCLRRATGAA